MSCRSKSSRDIYQADLAQLNAAWIDRYSAGSQAGEAPSGGDPSVELTPDGDANVEPGEHLEEFVVPACVKCGGILKVKASRSTKVYAQETPLGVVYRGFAAAATWSGVGIP